MTDPWLILEAYDRAWAEQAKPNLSEAVAALGGLDSEFVDDLFAIHLERRLRLDPTAKVVEELLAVKPTSDLASLIEQERQWKKRLGGPVLDAEYHERFPTWNPVSTFELQLPGYRLEERLGAGGMGVVYRATQLSLQRPVAIKLLHPSVQQDPEALSRLRTEAMAVARLRHPHVVAIHEVVAEGDLLYLVLEYVSGSTLADRAERQPFTPDEAVELVQTLARTLADLHRLGIIHRDLKPANVLLTSEGTPKIADFGLAKLAGDTSAATVTGQILGTPSYMAPEQAAGGSLTSAVDVYGLGAILYRLLTGQAPFAGESAWATLRAVQHEEPSSVRLHRPEVSRDLETVVLKCLEKNPLQRYESASALADELDRLLRGEPILARPIGPVQRLTKWGRRNPWASTVLAVLSLATVITSVLAWFYLRASQEAEMKRQQADLALERETSAKLETLFALARAETAEKAERQRANLEAEAREAQEFAVYQGQLQLVELDLKAGQDDVAGARLQRLNPKYRGWEADYWAGRVRRSELIWKAEAAIRGFAVSGDGKQVAVHLADDRVLVRSIGSKGPIRVLSPPSRKIREMHFMPDGKKLLILAPEVGIPTTARSVVWDIAMNQLVTRLESAGSFGDISPDGRYLATAHGGAKLVDLTTGKTVQNLALKTTNGAATYLAGVRFASDGKSLWASNGQDFKSLAWPLGPNSRWENAGPVTGGTAGRTLISPSGQYVVALANQADSRTKLLVLEPRTGHRTSCTLEDELLDFVISPDEQELVTLTRSGVVETWRLPTVERVSVTVLPRLPQVNVVARQLQVVGKQILVLQDGELWSVPREVSRPACELLKGDANDRFHQVQVVNAPLGTHLVAASQVGIPTGLRSRLDTLQRLLPESFLVSRLQVWSATSAKPRTLALESRPEAPVWAWSIDPQSGQSWFAQTPQDKATKGILWRRQGLEEPRSVAVEIGGISSQSILRFWPNSRQFLRIEADVSRKLWRLHWHDRQTGQEQETPWTLERESLALHRVALSDSGQYLAILTLQTKDLPIDGTRPVETELEVLDLKNRTSRVLQRQSLSLTTVSAQLMFRPETHHLLVNWVKSTNQSELALHDVDTSQQLWTAQPPQPFSALTILPDGSRLVASAANDPTGSLELWELTTGRFLTKLPNTHRRPVVHLACSQDGQSIIAAHGDEVLSRWHLPTKKPFNQSD